MKDYSDYSLSSESGRASYFLFNYLIIRTYMERTKFPIFPRVFSITKNNISRWFYFLKEDDNFEKELDGYINNLDLLDEAEVIMKDTTEKAKKKFNRGFSGLTNQELIDYFNFFCEKATKLIYFTASIRSADRAIMPKLKKILTPKEIDIALLPLKPVFIVREELALRELAVKLFKEGKKPEKDDVSDIHSRFLWAFLGYYNEKLKTKKEYVETLKKMIEDDPVGKLESLKNRLKKEEDVQKALFAKYDTPVLKILPAFVYLKDVYKESINKLIVYSDDLFNEIAKRTDRSLRFIKNLAPDETIDLLKGKKLDEALIKERTRHSIVLCDNRKFTVLSGNDADKFEEKYITKLYAGKNEFKGRGVSKGFGKGKVKIVLTVDDFGKVEKGDILTVMNTSPEFVPIMKKASAIIAEDGSLSSHVSVISREFGIPCVVGLDVITKILKDGEMVEVDADKGIVRKVK